MCRACIDAQRTGPRAGGLSRGIVSPLELVRASQEKIDERVPTDRWVAHALGRSRIGGRRVWKEGTTPRAASPATAAHRAGPAADATTAAGTAACSTGAAQSERG